MEWFVDRHAILVCTYLLDLDSTVEIFIHHIVMSKTAQLCYKATSIMSNSLLVIEDQAPDLNALASRSLS